MKKGMKKSLCLFGALMIGAAVIFSGCGGSGGGASDGPGPEDEVAAVIDGFFTTIQSGDLSQLTEYCTEEVVETELNGIKGAEDFENAFYESINLDGMGLTQDDLTDEAKAAVSELSNSIIKNMIGSYEISDISVNKDTAEVKGTITYGYDSTYNIDVEAINAEYMDSMSEEQVNELAEIYLNEGEAAMQKKMLNDMMPGLMEKYGSTLFATEGSTDTMEATLTKTDGKWMITEMNTQPAEEAGVSE